MLSMFILHVNLFSVRWETHGRKHTDSIHMDILFFLNTNLYTLLFDVLRVKAVLAIIFRMFFLTSLVEKEASVQSH
jgi:hypothetical protein